MLGSIRICGDRIAYFVSNGCSPGPNTSRSVSAPSGSGGRSGLGGGGADSWSVSVKLSSHETPKIGLPAMSCS